VQADGGQPDPPVPQVPQRLHGERPPGAGHLGRPRPGREQRLVVVQRPGPRHIGVAHRPPGPVQGLGQPLGGQVEGQPHQRHRLLVASEHGRPQPAREPDPLPRLHRRGRRPGVGRDQRRVGPVRRHPQHQRRPPLAVAGGQPDLERLPPGGAAEQAGRERAGVVDHQQVARLEQPGQLVEAVVADRPGGAVDGQQPDVVAAQAPGLRRGGRLQLRGEPEPDLAAHRCS
jgi:hypothetical protein